MLDLNSTLTQKGYTLNMLEQHVKSVLPKKEGNRNACVSYELSLH